MAAVALDAVIRDVAVGMATPTAKSTQQLSALQFHVQECLLHMLAGGP